MAASSYGTPGQSSPSSAAHRISHDPSLPPAPPPKPNSQDVSRQGTPATAQYFPPPSSESQGQYSRGFEPSKLPEAISSFDPIQLQRIQDPGNRWLPKILEDKSKRDPTEILRKPELLSALVHSRRTAHLSSIAAQEVLQAALSENTSLASHLNELENRLIHLRSSTQAQLLSTHALERQWRQKQSDMDRALLPFSPSSLYQKLSQGVQEQEMVCRALEESFLDGDWSLAAEREINEWIRRYRDAKTLYYSRKERKERWDEGRVGGWR